MRKNLSFINWVSVPRVSAMYVNETSWNFTLKNLHRNRGNVWFWQSPWFATSWNIFHLELVYSSSKRLDRNSAANESRRFPITNDFILIFQNEKKELEEKFRKAMVANAGLDNEKSQLNYQVKPILLSRHDKFKSCNVMHEIKI